MTDQMALKKHIEELAERVWDMGAIEARYKELVDGCIPRKRLAPAKFKTEKQQILDRVQRRAEEYNYLGNNCPRATALALMEEFGIGSMEIIKALAPFPGLGGTGSICGGVTGALICFGLYFGSENMHDQESVGASIMAAQQFLSRFKEQVGSTLCSEIQEKVVFGRYMDPGASPAHMEAFVKEKGTEKCSLLPGIGARLAAEIIIDSMK